MTNLNQEIKIAVYAICKNEASFANRWIQNMWCAGKGASQVFVLDTGSTDNTIDALYQAAKELNIPEGWLVMAQQEISPWRFDAARNINLQMIPEGQFDACYCIDLDELVIEDFWKDFRDMVRLHPDFERIYYKYAWSHDDTTGEPKSVFWYDKTHGARGGWYWKYPVHEALICSQADKESLNYSGIYYLDTNKIYLHHYPDQTKSRGSYLGLLELRASEYPEDLYGLFYLAREYSFVSRWEDELKTAIQLYARLKKGNPSAEELSARDDMQMLPSTCLLIGDSFSKLGMYSDAEHYYGLAVEAAPTYRLGYIKLAQTQAYQGRYVNCYSTMEAMNKNSVRTLDWRDVAWSWRDWKRYQILADAKCWEGDYQEASRLFEFAMEDLKTEDDHSDAFKEGFYSDYGWLINKLNSIAQG